MIKDKIKNTIKKIVYLLIPVIIILLLFRFLFFGAIVQSNSMSPALKKGTAIVASRMAYKSRKVKRGDIIIFNNDGEQTVKRVIGLPGEKIRFQDGFVIINDKVYDEEYISDNVETNSNEQFEVPKGSYFVLGDNREHSYDSRFTEDPYVKKSQITGKVFFSFGKGSTGVIPSVKTNEE